MDGAGHRVAATHEAQQTGAQTLVVMNDVVARARGFKVSEQTMAEGERLREPPTPIRCPLKHIQRITPALLGQRPCRVRVCIQIQTRKPHKINPSIQLRIGFTRDHVDSMAHVDQGFGKVLEIDALSATVGVAAITQQGNVQWFMAVCWA